MKRRNLLYAVSIGVAAAALPAPAISQGIRELKMVTSWPKGLPGLGGSAERMAKSIASVTGGKVQVKVFGAGELVKPFEVFDAVSAGVADIYHSAEYYWEAKSPGFCFFAAVPFGFTGDELAAWVHFGGGQALWDELSASFNVKALLSTNTGVQMGGWFTKEVQGPESYAGLRYRMPGLGGEVLRRLGAVVVNLPGGEIAPALQSGAIDASEWVGPWNDMVLGLHKVSKYYYYPGFHEPGTALATGLNKRVWDSFSAEERGLDCHGRQRRVHDLAGGVQRQQCERAAGAQAEQVDRNPQVRRRPSARARQDQSGCGGGGRTEGSDDTPHLRELCSLSRADDALVGRGGSSLPQCPPSDA